MKTYLFRSSRHLWLCFFVLISPAVLLEGCKRITSADISGIYRRSNDGVIDTVVLETNGTFQQTITSASGGPWIKSGSWKFGGQVVEFSEFYEAFTYDTVKRHAVIVIPPESGASEVLWVEEGKLLKNSVEPIWLKQQAK